MKNKYVLLTAARNEEEFIEKTIKSVINQSILPEKWIIVIDNAIDGTYDIAHKYSLRYNYIQVVKILDNKPKNFASKAEAITTGYQRLINLPYDFIGILDADISLDSNYYESIIFKFHKNIRLGLSGGVRYDICNGKKIKIDTSPNSVGGGYQLFRRQTYEEIGGIIPMEMGGEDAVAEAKVRMCGWNVESFPEVIVCHNRCTGDMYGNPFKISFNLGVRDFHIGNHPLFELFKSIDRMIQKPYLVKGMLLLFGYLWAFLRYKGAVSEDFKRYIRKEQILRLKRKLLL